MEEQNEIIKVPNIETERLVLRALSRDDIEFIFHHFSQDEINQCSQYENLANMEEAIEFYEKFIAPTNPTRFRLGMVLKETNELIGTLGYYSWSRKDYRAEIGCDLAKKYWGRGLMTEALQALIRFGFETMKLNRIEATTNSKNERAIKLLDRIRFKKEGSQRQKYYYKGQFHDDLLYSLLKEEWKL